MTDLGEDGETHGPATLIAVERRSTKVTMRPQRRGRRMIVRLNWASPRRVVNVRTDLHNHGCFQDFPAVRQHPFDDVVMQVGHLTSLSGLRDFS